MNNLASYKWLVILFMIAMTSFRKEKIGNPATGWSRYFAMLVAMCVLTCLLSCDGEGEFPTTQQGGKTVENPDVRPNPEVISPLIVVPPLLNCAASVTVKGFIPGAKIRIYSNGTMIGEGTGIDPELQTFDVSPVLATGQSITATQEFDGLESAPSSAESVQDVSVVYPAGLPKPGFPFLYLYECGIATYVDNLPPGGQLRVFEQPDPTATKNLVGSVNGVAEGQSVGIGPAFIKDHLVTAESQICTDISPASDTQQVQQAPSTIPKPTTDPIIEGATFIVVHGLVNGAKASIKRAGSVIATFGAPAGHVRVNGVTVSAGDVLDIEQELCGVSSGPTTTTVLPCSALTPPHLIGPHAGDTIGLLTNVVAGSRIQIYSGSEEIADGGGSVVAYTRPLVDGETLTVIQSLGSCVSISGYVVPVGAGLEDPGIAGPCGRVREFEYGSSNDPDGITTDVSSYFNSPEDDVTVPMNAVPLHGVVRYPDGPGPFPLVLIVHGNHSPTDPSFDGYDYLLDLLASQCMIAVSIEEDFLNGNVSGEMDARGIVLLRHLQLWREWNRTPGHPFFTKVNMGSIGLAGHSRGGEAIAAANFFNSSLHTPTDPPVGSTSHNFGFGIQSLYAIAPVDGQFDGGPMTLTNADYYVMHGTHDGDVSGFSGQKFYNRAFPVNNPTDQFKGLLWVYGANHGQWNTGWGTCCETAVGPSPLISAGDQRQIAKTYMSAYFLAGLKGWAPYRYFLNGEATFASLPAGVTRVFQYQDPKRIFVNHYEEDTDPATGSLPGVNNAPSGTFVNYEVYAFSDQGSPHFLWGQTQGLIAGWATREVALRININDGTIPDYRYLALHVGQTLESTPNLNTPGVDQDFSIQLEFEKGTGPEIAISSYGRLVYPLQTNFRPKSVQQTIRVPFADLRMAASDRPRDVRRIILRFNRKPSGNVAIDEIQFTN